MIKLVSFQSKWISGMMTWFHDRSSVEIWGGRDFRFPYTFESFQEDLNLKALNTYALLKDGKLIAFGQTYQRLDKCHLARLIVDPEKRGEGFGKILIKALAHRGSEKLKLTGCSLFVDSRNIRAHRLYKLLGFNVEAYPGEIPFAGCNYMVKRDLFSP